MILLKAIQKNVKLAAEAAQTATFSVSTQRPVYQESIRSSSRKQYQRIIPKILLREFFFFPSCTVL